MFDELGLSSRGATMADAPAVHELVQAAEVADVGEGLMELSDIETDWAMPLVDISRDVILLYDGDRLVACGEVREERADADVHPDDRGRGIGAALVKWTEQRALDRAAPGAAVRIGQTVPEGLDGTRALFASRGYERLWDSWVLRFPPEAELGDPAPPPRTAIRPFRADEEREIYTIVDDAFSEWEGRESRPFDDWQARTTARPDFDPTLLYVAVVDDQLVGMALGIHFPGEGWLEQVAVRPEFRGQGIARALLITIFGEFRARGEHRLGLNTDSRTGALDLYLNLGMILEHTFVRWSRLLRAAPTG
jgi:mycothiol synthase